MEKSLAGKLLAFQKEVGTIKKDLENPYFKSQYFDVNAVIEVIRPILNKVGLIVLQPFLVQEGKNILSTEICDVDTGEKYSSYIILPDTLKPQEMGSAITYFRRYSLVSMLLLQGEVDDDGNIASNAKRVYPTYDPASAPKKVKPVDTKPILNDKGQEVPFN